MLRYLPFTPTPYLYQHRGRNGIAEIPYQRRAPGLEVIDGARRHIRN
jgi:hypothetical protein